MEADATVSQSNEVWKPVIGYDGLYEVSNLGRIVNRKTGTIRKPTYSGRGRYPAIILPRGGGPKTAYIHRIVATAFLGHSQDKPQVNHINGNVNDNRADNLEWCTNSENNLHAFRVLGRVVGTAKFTPSQAVEIYKLAKLPGSSCPAIAKKYGVCKHTVYRIARGATYSRFTGAEEMSV